MSNPAPYRIEKTTTTTENESHDYTTEQKIWTFLDVIMSTATTAHDWCSELVSHTGASFQFFSPLSGKKTITDDPADFEVTLERIEATAGCAAADLADIASYTRLIRGALNQLKKEKAND